MTTMRVSRVIGHPLVVYDIYADGLRELELTYTLEYLVPRLAQVVAVRVSDSDQGLDALHVFRLHFGDGRGGGEQRESGERLHVRISLQLQIEYASDANGAADAVQTQIDDFGVVRVL